MKRKFITFLMIVISFLLQCTLFTKIAPGSIKPNLLLILTCSLGLMRGRKNGMFVGLFCGLFADLFWGNVLGYSMLIYAVIGYLNGSFRRMFFDEDIKLPIALIAVSDFVFGVINYACLYMLQGTFAFGYYLIHTIMPELVYTVLITLVMYQIILQINRRLEAEEQRSASKFV